MGGEDGRDTVKNVSQVEGFLRTARALLEQAERAASDQRLIMKVGVELGASLEYEATLQNVARLIVEDFADWCLVDVVDRQGRVRDAAVAHRATDKEELARSLVRGLPQLPSAPHGVARVLRTMQPESYSSDVDDPGPLGHYFGAEYPDALRELGARSYICVPMVAREKAIGAVTYVRGSNSPAYEERDLSLAQELARRAGVAIENALLHRETSEAVRERDELLAIFSHDVRNLLNTISRNVEVMRQGEGPIDAECLGRISVAAQRMKRLVDDTLDVSRVEGNGLQLDKHAHDVEALVSDSVDAVWNAARAKAVNVESHVPSGVRLRCDPTRMFQALVNLLDNAIRHSPDGGRVVVDVQAERAHVAFSVSDAGPGIPEELPRLFDRFWQGRSQHRAGAGLGLTIVKGVVEGHGGRIWVESVSGQGATFRFEIPLSGRESRPPSDALKTNAMVEPSTAHAISPAALRSATVFLADDDEEFRTGLKQALVARGYEVREANDGATALELRARAADGRHPPPDVVVLDVRMPGCSGLGVLTQWAHHGVRTRRYRLRGPCARACPGRGRRTRACRVTPRGWRLGRGRVGPVRRARARDAPAAFAGVDCTYYLVHSMGAGQRDFRATEQRGATAVVRIATESGVKRLVYLGGVEPEGPPSEHLASRLDVGAILRSGTVQTVELRASMIVGNGSASWQILAPPAQPSVR
jgi:signal transduction histidine kinase